MEHLILSLLIVRNRHFKDLKIYLAPLVNDKRNLSNGVDAIDVSN